MRPAGIYLLEVQFGRISYSNLPSGSLLFTLRIGKSHSSIALQPLTDNQFAGVLQLNVDSSALEAQRCSLSLNMNTATNKKLLGIALISLPKDKKSIDKSYPLTQSADKKAQIDLKIRINPIDSMGAVIKEEPIKEAGSSSMSNIKVKSKHSQGSGDGEKKVPRNYKLAENDQVIETTMGEVKRYKAEKQTYYQLYQIEKAKNEVASKFISTVIKKLSEKYPHLLPTSSSSLSGHSDIKKRGSEVPRNRNSVDAATIDQLEQANRCLHRQVEDYKKMVEQLKKQIIASAKPSEHGPSRNTNKTNFFDFGNARTTSKDRSNIIPASLKENQEAESHKDTREALEGLDLKKWLQASVGQREALQSKMAKTAAIPPERPENRAVLIKKVRSGIDKAFSQFLSGKDFGRPALLSHKQQINKVLDDCIAA